MNLNSILFVVVFLVILGISKAFINPNKPNGIILQELDFSKECRSDDDCPVTMECRDKDHCICSRSYIYVHPYRCLRRAVYGESCEYTAQCTAFGDFKMRCNLKGYCQCAKGYQLTRSVCDPIDFIPKPTEPGLNKRILVLITAGVLFVLFAFFVVFKLIQCRKYDQPYTISTFSTLSLTIPRNRLDEELSGTRPNDETDKPPNYQELFIKDSMFGNVPPPSYMAAMNSSITLNAQPGNLTVSSATSAATSRNDALSVPTANVSICTSTTRPLGVVNNAFVQQE